MEMELANVEQKRSVMDVETSRAIQEVQAALVIAKRYPRDEDQAYIEIMNACERYSLADQAEYSYPRGGATVSGPSVRLAEVLAQKWGNLQWGVRELSQSAGESEVESFCWDMEKNNRQIKTFHVAHSRYTKKRGIVDLSDPRDIYEMTANQGARRMRSCILGIIPGDIVEKAVAQCRVTLKKGIEEGPIEDQIRATLRRFDSLGITKEMIEHRLGHPIKATTAEELVDLHGIGKSIKDNMTSRQEWFDFEVEAKKATDDLTAKIKGKPSAGTPPASKEPPDTPPGEREPLGDPPEGVTFDPVDLFTLLKKMRPSTSPDNMAKWVKTVEDYADEIRDLPKNEYTYVLKKWEKACPAQVFPAAPGTVGRGEAPQDEPLNPEIVDQDTGEVQEDNQPPDPIDVKVEEILSTLEKNDKGSVSSWDFSTICKEYASKVPDYKKVLGYGDSTDVPMKDRAAAVERLIRAAEEG